MTITQQQLHTLRLLRKGPAHRIYRPHYPDDYSWVHKDAQKPVTATLHRLFSRGYATITPDDRNLAVITERGHAVVAAWGSC